MNILAVAQRLLVEGVPIKLQEVGGGFQFCYIIELTFIFFETLIHLLFELLLFEHTKNKLEYKIYVTIQCIVFILIIEKINAQFFEDFLVVVGFSH